MSNNNKLQLKDKQQKVNAATASKSKRILQPHCCFSHSYPEVTNDAPAPSLSPSIGALRGRHPGGVRHPNPKPPSGREQPPPEPREQVPVRAAAGATAQATGAPATAANALPRAAPPPPGPTRALKEPGPLLRTYPLVGLRAEAVERYLPGHISDAGDVGVVLLQGRQTDLLLRSAYRLHLDSQQPLAAEAKKQPRGVDRKSVV